MSTRLIVIGAGGFARETLDVLDAVERRTPGAFEVLGVFDDRPSAASRQILARRGVHVIGTIGDLLEGKVGEVDAYVIAIGDPAARLDIAARVRDDIRPAPALVHPLASIGTDTVLEPGVIVCAGAVVSANVTLGRHTHVNPNATIGHDAVLGWGVSVNPAAVVSGSVVVGDGVLLGAASVVLQGLTVGARAVVGAAACVTRDVLPGSTVVGVPAR